MRGYEFLVRETGQPVPEGYRVYGTVSAFADWDFYFPCGQDPLAAMMCPLFLKPPAYALMRVVPRVSRDFPRAFLFRLCSGSAPRVRKSGTCSAAGGER